MENFDLHFELRLSHLYVLTEPIGSKTPTFSSDSKTSSFVRPEGKGFAVLCQAQGLPTPTFRTYKQPCAKEPTSNVSPKKVGAEFGGWRVVNVLKDAVAWLPCQLTVSLSMITFATYEGSHKMEKEPTSNVPPKKDGKKFEGWEVLSVPSHGTAWLTCQVTEPTNNVPPKKDGEKFTGWKDVSIRENQTAWLTCQVTWLSCTYLYEENAIKTLELCQLNKMEIPKILVIGEVELDTTASSFPACKFIIHCQMNEPTNNVPPKSSGRRIDGSILQEVAESKDVMITCDVSGYPVPVFRTYWSDWTEDIRRWLDKAEWEDFK
nr:unnamed protein product [Callosobruchus analis]